MKEDVRVPFGRNRLGAYIYGVSWAAILAGVVMALVIHLMLSVLGVGIGAATVDPQREQSPLSGLGIGSAIWLFLSTIVAMYIGGWIAGRYSGHIRRTDGLLHGSMMWAVTVLVAVFFLTSAAGSLISGSARIFGGLVTTTTQATATSPALSEEIKQALRERGIDIESIRQQAQNPQTQQRAEQEAREAGQKVASGLSRAGIFGFFMLLVGLAAAAFGGRNGVPLALRAEAIPPSERVA